MLCAMFELGKTAMQRGSPAGRNTTFRGWEEKFVISVISVIFLYVLDSVLLLDYVIFLLSKHSELYQKNTIDLASVQKLRKLIIW